jgi:hypothetical protein
MKLKDLLNTKQFLNWYEQLKQICEKRDIELYFDWEGRLNFKEKE